MEVWEFEYHKTVVSYFIEWKRVNTLTAFTTNTEKKTEQPIDMSWVKTCGENINLLRI